MQYSVLVVEDERDQRRALIVELKLRGPVFVHIDPPCGFAAN